MKYIIIGMALLFNIGLFAQNQPPVIQYLQSTYNVPDKYFVSYNLSDAENDPVEITLLMSIDSGQTYSKVTNATGDVGFPVMPSVGNKLIEMPADTFPGWTLVFFKLIADDRQPVNIQSIVDQVDSNRLKNHLMFIQGARNHLTNSAHLYIVRDSLANYFSSLGLATEIQTGINNGYPLRNIIGEKTGILNEQKILIADAHYDGVPGSPAADDNGSGVAALMEAAKILSQYQFKNSLQFIGFDTEEYGLLGSDYYVDNLSSSDTIAGVINFEMIGYYSERVNSQELPLGFNLLFPSQTATVEADSFRGNFITNIANTASSNLKKAFDSAAANYVPALKVISLEVTGNGTIAPDLRRSDHASFWDANIPALMITNTSEYRNNNYHTVNDVLDSLNFTFMSQVTKAAIATLAEVAGITNSSYAITPLLPQVNIKEKSSLDAKIYPNPAKNAITIDFNNSKNVNYFIEIVSVSGQSVFESHIKKGSKRLTINSQDFPSGIYLIIISDGKQSQTSKINIEH